MRNSKLEQDLKLASAMTDVQIEHEDRMNKFFGRFLLYTFVVMTVVFIILLITKITNSIIPYAIGFLLLLYIFFKILIHDYDKWEKS